MTPSERPLGSTGLVEVQGLLSRLILQLNRHGHNGTVMSGRYGTPSHKRPRGAHGEHSRIPVTTIKNG